MQGKRVLIAMSGGVDSSVAAALLKKRGYGLVGVTMRLGNHDSADLDPTDRPTCCSLEGVEDARRVAAQLGIPFYALNYEEAFRREVVDYFCDEYSRGRTPNPCIICNEKLKFGKLMEMAQGLGIDYVATGHYARVEPDGNGRFLLKRGVDRIKDQSYALFSLSQDQLSRIIFPLGELRKSEVRNLAATLGLKTADKRESQDICFIQDNNYPRFLREKIPERIKPGPIITTDGEIVGQHDGVQFYTVGQRKGLGVSLGVPVYVVRIDPSRNTIVVGRRESLLRCSFTVSGFNLIAYESLDRPVRCQVKIRYRDPGHPAVIEQIDSDRVRITYDKPYGAVTPGQAAVCYNDDVVIGGGWIES